MGVEMKGFLELTGDLEKLADEFVDAGGNLSSILRNGAKPILEKAKANVPVRSGDLKNSLKTVTRKKGAWYKARIGAQKGSPGFYATFVEYGHGGPHPAPPHPFLAPAYDATVEEAYGIIKGELKQKLTKL